MKLFRLPLLFLFAFSLTALCLRAEEPQKQAPATKPATKPATRVDRRISRQRALVHCQIAPVSNSAAVARST